MVAISVLLPSGSYVGWHSMPLMLFEVLSDVDWSDHVWTVCSCISTCRAICNCIVDSLVTLVHTLQVYCSNKLRGNGGVLKLAHFEHPWLVLPLAAYS